MRQHRYIQKAYLIAFLCGGCATSTIGWTHWEGFEAADPATPAALLTLDSAVERYTALDVEPLPWRESIESDRDSSMTGGQSEVETGAGTSPHSGHTPATTQK